MEDIRKQIIKWFNGPQDYDQGIELLQRISRKSRVLGKLARRGETKTSFEKLTYELNKVAGLKKIPVPKAKMEAGLIKIPLPPLKPDQPEELKVAKPIKEKTTNPSMNLAGKVKGDLSPVMQRVVKENSALCMQRGKKHKALTSLPDDNSKEAMDERVKLMNDIEKMTSRIEVLFIAWEEYNKRGVDPDPDELWPEEGEKQEEKISIDSMDIEQLKREKKNLQASLAKDRNMLKYRSKTKPDDEKENPVPDGPKRKRLEKRIKEKEELILAIDNRIVDIE
jgi:hypothetical protein